MTPEERQAEIIRRRNARLVIFSPGTYYVQYRFAKLGGYYDKKFKQWTFPDQESLEKARELVAHGEKEFAHDIFQEKGDWGQ